MLLRCLLAFDVMLLAMIGPDCDVSRRSGDAPTISAGAAQPRR
jgi:hypothetical protein